MTAIRGGAEPAILVAGLTKAYDGRTVVRDLSLEVRRGEIVALLGPNGAGKTTTVEIIEGYRRPDRGSARVLGADPARAGRDHRARVGLMLQGGGGIDPRMTAREVVALHARFHSAPRDVDELLQVVGLAGASIRTRYRRLSGGEKQRVGLALALVGRPEVAILDEPAAAMDVEARAMTRDLLTGLRDEGAAILLTSHDLTDVERVASRIAILDRGRLVAEGPPDSLGSGATAGIRFRLAAGLDDADRQVFGDHLAGLAGAAVLVAPDGGPGRYRIDGLTPTPAALAAVAAWCASQGLLIVELRTGAGSLEERYLELVGAGSDEEVLDDGGSEGSPTPRRPRDR